MLYPGGIQMATSKLDKWKELITEWQESGKTRKEFCLEKDLTIANFGYWRTRINKLESIQVAEKEGFVQCNLSSFSTKGFTIEWPDGMRISFPANIKFQEFTALVRALRVPQ